MDVVCFVYLIVVSVMIPQELSVEEVRNPLTGSYSIGII